MTEVFKKWEACEVKGQVKTSAKLKKKKATINASPSLAEDMKIGEWAKMQGLHQEDLILTVLQRVIKGELTLQEMGNEFMRHKTQLKVELAFQKSFGLNSWSACKETYPEHCIDVFL